MIQELIFEVYCGALMGFGILALTCIIYWKSPEHDELKQDEQSKSGGQS